jgi:hypothetical protein
MKTFLILSALLLLLIGASASFGMEDPKKVGGNRVLMEQRAARKALVQQKIFEALKQAQQIPRHGIVEYEARVKQDPQNKDNFFIVIDKVKVIERPPQGENRQQGVQGKDPSSLSEMIFKPIDSSGYVEKRNIDLGNAEVVNDRIEIENFGLVGGGANLDKNDRSP